MALFKRREEQDPPPRRADFGDDEHAYLTMHLIWQCGGSSRLTPDRLEIAALIAGLMIDMRTARPVDLVKHADVLERLMARLPLTRTPVVSETITDGMSLQQVAMLYGRLCGDPGIELFDDVRDVSPSAPVSLTPAPGDRGLPENPRSAGDAPSKPVDGGISPQATGVPPAPETPLGEPPAKPVPPFPQPARPNLGAPPPPPPPQAAGAPKLGDADPPPPGRATRFVQGIADRVAAKADELADRVFGPEPDPGPAYIAPPTKPRFAGGKWGDEPADPPPAEPEPERVKFVTDERWRTRLTTIGGT